MKFKLISIGVVALSLLLGFSTTADGWEPPVAKLVQVEGKVDSSLYENLKVVLNSSAYWRDRFAEFGLHPEHLLEGKFPAGIDYIRDAIASEADLPTQLV